MDLDNLFQNRTELPHLGKNSNIYIFNIIEYHKN